ncbi:hypothetical protein [Streptomyces sp. NBC_01751]|uniref:hypothetical protein n=1 Tax=Streptomyces sp. NBC_01751 TaxID=2975929 RepID=UPI002DD7B29E|nr:hypothetical protein [Streptomyces sp. NBC_01751]WSD24580.1 hypothetical protein OHA26_14395 [Streptomyces sp. NBC_01751]
MIICTRSLRKASNHRGAAYADAFLKELFRLMGRQHRLGFGRDFRATRNGGPRTFLPLVAATPVMDGYGSRYPALEYRVMSSTPLDLI